MFCYDFGLTWSARALVRCVIVVLFIVIWFRAIIGSLRLQLPCRDRCWNDWARELFTWIREQILTITFSLQWHVSAYRFSSSPLIASKSFLNATISWCSMLSVWPELRISSFKRWSSVVTLSILPSIRLSRLSMASFITFLSSFFRPNSSGSMNLCRDTENEHRAQAQRANYLIKVINRPHNAREHGSWVHDVVHSVEETDAMGRHHGLRLMCEVHVDDCARVVREHPGALECNFDFVIVQPFRPQELLLLHQRAAGYLRILQKRNRRVDLQLCYAVSELPR